MKISISTHSGVGTFLQRFVKHKDNINFEEECNTYKDLLSCISKTVIKKFFLVISAFSRPKSVRIGVFFISGTKLLLINVSLLVKISKRRERKIYF